MGSCQFPAKECAQYWLTILIRHCILQHLIWVCTVCQLPFYGSTNYKGLNFLVIQFQAYLAHKSEFHYQIKLIYCFDTNDWCRDWLRWLSWMRRPTGDQEVVGSTPTEVGNILSWRLIIFSTVILSLPLIQEGQLSVSGERMCTILVNRLED